MRKIYDNEGYLFLTIVAVFLFILSMYGVYKYDDDKIAYANAGLQQCQRIGSGGFIWQKECKLTGD